MADYFQYLPFDYAAFIATNLILSAIIILLERKNPTAALAWLFFLLLVPGFGFFFYIIFSQNISKRKIFRYTREEASLFKRYLNQQRNAIKVGEFSFIDKTAEKYKDIILFHNRLSKSIYSQNNHLTYYTTGDEKFESLFKDLKEAAHHIHISYFIIKDDRISNDLFDLLIEKAAAGVEVRLLIDFFGGRRIKPSTIKRINQSNVHLSFFFPSRFHVFNLRNNYRNHRKIAVIDGRIGYIGGFNVGDEYLGLNERFGAWRDTHLRIVGDAVLSLQLRFILDWRNASKEQLDFTSLYMQNVTTTSSVGMQIVDSGPDSKNEQIKQGYLQMIHQAKKYIYIQTPYFVPDESIIEGLKIAAAKGVEVKIMIPNKPDHPFVYWATYSYCGDLLPYGVRIFTYEYGFLHSKAIVIDDEVASVGTCNFDIRSFKLNFEVNAFIYDSTEAIKLRHIFEEDSILCRELTLRRYKKRPLTIKIKESFSRLFSPVL